MGFTSLNIEKLPNSIKSLKFLEKLELTNSDIKDLQPFLKTIHFNYKFPNILIKDTEKQIITSINRYYNDQLVYSNNLEKTQLGFSSKNEHVITLKISNVKLTSQIQSLIRHLPNLEYLILNNTNLTQFPEEIFDLPKIRCIDLKFNAINTLPYWINTLKNLRYIFLDSEIIEKIDIPRNWEKRRNVDGSFFLFSI